MSQTASGTLLIDFDSTLVSCESLEIILAGRGVDPATMDEIRRTTELGMAGILSFWESLSKRLELATPTRDDLREFSTTAEAWLTPGMAALLADLESRGVEVHIGSGAIYDAIEYLAASLGIPGSRVHAVEVLWDPGGHFAGLKPGCAFARSKSAGVAELVTDWPRPCVAVGDGMPDYRLYRDGLVEHFIAFTQHARRAEVLSHGIPEAANVSELRLRLEQIYGFSLTK